MSNSVVFKGRKYSSLAELARKLNVSSSTLFFAMKRSKNFEQEVNKLLRKKKGIYVVEGIHYKSKRAVADAYGINYRSFVSIIDRHKCTLENALFRVMALNKKEFKKGQKLKKINAFKLNKFAVKKLTDFSI